MGGADSGKGRKMKKEEIFKRKAAEKSTADSDMDPLDRLEKYNSLVIICAALTIIFSTIAIVLSISTMLRLLPQLLQQL